jgi:hypothetical protein
MRDCLFLRVLHGTLPLIIWAAHFFAVYLLVAAQCSHAAPGYPSRRMLGVFSLLAIGACLVLLWRSRNALRSAGNEPALLDWAAAGSAVLATAGIAWTSVPIIMIEGCA